jgi:branched-chain amino acid transport system substrate-binding protein
VLALFTSARLSIQAYAVANGLGWRPFVVTNAAASAATVMAAASQRGTNTVVEGSVSIAFLKDPAAPRWRVDAGARLYRSIMSRYARGANARDLGHVYGMALAYETVRLLKAAGRTPTRAAVVEQLTRLRDASNPFLLPGIAIETGPAERFPVEQALLQRWSRGSWTSFGGLWSHRSG